jgi:hypothetical protein
MQQWWHAQEALHMSSWQEATFALRKYCLAVAAKDCSIMVSYAMQSPSANADAASMRASAVSQCQGCKQSVEKLIQRPYDSALEFTSNQGVQQEHTCVHTLMMGIHPVRFRIAIVDMDRKGTSKISKHRLLDQQILTAWHAAQ